MNKLDCSEKKYKIVCITQIYNEIRKQNLERFWKHINSVCDALVVYDDGSTDGSYEYMLDKATFIIRAGENDFKNEINHKKILLQYALKLQPDFILWLDADEVLTANAKEELQKLCKYADENNIDGISFHEINLWRSYSWKRIDNSYDLGWFVRLWRVTPNLMFKETTPGLHQQQYPHSIKKIEKTDRVSVIHYGFASERSLAFKYLTYRSHGQSGWALERLLDESTLTLEKVDKNLFPDGLYIDDEKPIPRSFIQAISSLDVYKEEVFKPRISIICLIYKSIEWLQFVYEQVLKYTNLNDKEFYFVANDANESVLQYLKNNYIPHYIWNNSEEQKKEWYINNVYRAWNFAAQKAKGDYLLFINSDMAFSHGWVENLFNKLNGKNCVVSRLVESGKLLSGEHAISKNFGRHIEDYDEEAFNKFADEIRVNELKDGGLFMPLLIRKDDFLSVGGYPEGNIVPGTDIFNPKIAVKGTPCISGDVVLMQKLKEKGISHTTSYDSIVYHFQCGEMDSHSTLPNNVNEKVRVIICNDYLSGRMGEKTMWNFLLSNLPNSVGVDKDSLNVDKDFEKEAKLFIKKNYPESAIVIQNASFMDIIDKDRFNILYLQDNLRAMGRKSLQQEANLKHADILVTNSKITAASYPEYNFEIIPIGIDGDLFKPMDKKNVRKEFNIPDQTVGIFVGDFSEVKGWSKVKSLIENHDEIFWIIVTKDENTYERKNVKVFNRISQEKLVKLLNCANFFILGSPVETQCFSALEACFCNLPIIMRNTGIFADFSEEEKERIGYFGEDFEVGLKKVLNQQFSPREIMYQKNLTIYGMVEKWNELISKARLYSEQKFLRPDEVRPPFFSVIVPTFNQAEYLGEALDSLLNQTFTNWEAIIVNDGSTDNTKDVIDKYLSMDKRFKAFHKENGGVASALNLGIKNARGEWICWLSSDDLFEPKKLEIHFNAIKQNPAIKFFHSHWYLLEDKTKQKIAPGLWLNIPPKEYQVLHFFWANYVHGNSVAIHKSVFDNVGLFDENLRQGQDFDMWLRISSKYESFFINKRTCITRLHKGQTTNTFSEGGIYDSTYSLIKFLNERPFEDLFPQLNLNNLNNILQALSEIIFISSKIDAFIYKCGFTSVLIDKTLDWINKLPASYRNKVYEFLNILVKEYLKNISSEEIRIIISKLLSRDKHYFKEFNFIENVSCYIKDFIYKGYQKKALSLEKYLSRFSKLLHEKNFSIKIYEPIFERQRDNNYLKLKIENVNEWFIEPINMTSIRHSFIIKCENCKHDFKLIEEYKLIENTTTFDFICPECKSHYQYSDTKLSEDLISFNNSKVKENNLPLNANPTIAFFIKDASVISGGVKIFFKHASTLLKLGANVVIYSFSDKPGWIDSNLYYYKINDIKQINHDTASLFIFFSIFDLTLLINSIPLSKVVHLCQGYEGFHYGENYHNVIHEKHLLKELHTIPVKAISVSTHLLKLFKESLNRESQYIPNSINHNIFKPNSIASKPNNIKSILFIGNPLHSLKGFDFLAAAITTIQNSNHRIENLELRIVVGNTIPDSTKFKEGLEKDLKCKVVIKIKLNESEIANLIKTSSVLVCTSWYEGFSLPVLEAMACGTPVITTNNMGVESYAIHNYNSFIVKYNDYQSMLSYLLDVLNNRIKLEPVLRNGYRTSLQFNEFNFAKSLINAYENLLGYSFDKVKKEIILSEAQKVSEVEKNNNVLFKDLLTVIMPVYNNVDYTKQSVESLLKTTPQLKQLIIIDNNSTDSTESYLRELELSNKNVKVIRNSMNIGFPAAVNQGMKIADTEFVIVANNDIIFTEHWAERIIEIADSDNKIGMVGPISNIVSGVQIDINAKYNSIEEMHRYAAEVREKNKGQVLQFPRIAFLCSLIKKEVIDKIGGLDERFSPGNYEDDDFCLRAQLAGYKTVIAKDVFIHHYGSKSFKADGNEAYRKRLEKNRQIFVDKWGADPDEIWLKNKTIKNRQFYYPINRDLFKQYFERTKVHIADNELYLAQDTIVSAIENFKESDAQHIEYDDLLDLAGNIFLANNNIDKAREYFEKELNLNPASSPACYGLGRIFFAQQNYEAAKIMFEWAVKNNPQNIAAKNALEKVNELLGYELSHSSLEGG
ncbi:glycosyltransferase [Rosettibacter firmus]|uniref:glycosyltransferase n=1 Tax=Rosettibacter firmus TaxID=3111522 RepID=UPI00336BB5A2